MPSQLSRCNHRSVIQLPYALVSVDKVTHCSDSSSDSIGVTIDLSSLRTHEFVCISRLFSSFVLHDKSTHFVLNFIWFRSSQVPRATGRLRRTNQMVKFLVPIECCMDHGFDHCPFLVSRTIYTRSIEFTVRWRCCCASLNLELCLHNYGKEIRFEKRVLIHVLHSNQNICLSGLFTSSIFLRNRDKPSILPCVCNDELNLAWS